MTFVSASLILLMEKEIAVVSAAIEKLSNSTGFTLALLCLSYVNQQKPRFSSASVLIFLTV